MSAPRETVYRCEYAWLGGEGAEPDVEITVTAGRIASVVRRASMTNPAAAGGSAAGGEGASGAAPVVPLPGLTLPGLANTHSHVFHRAIRGRTQAGAADFWQWRKVMYQAASRLDPDTLYTLAKATYVEMLLAGVTSVGEFFYVHHRPDGARYHDPNEMGLAVTRAAIDAGLRITLLDTCYLQAGVDGTPPEGAQIRYSDGSWQAWAERVGQLRETGLAASDLVTIGAAIHSVRAVPATAMRPIAEYCARAGLPLHAHVSEQPAENEACLAVHGLTPVEVLAAQGVLSPQFTAVHATHLTDRDIALLGGAGVTISMCPSTERDLADGVGPAIRLSAAGARLAVGSDGHMMIDLLAEGRAVELDERLVSGTRGHLTGSQIARALTTDGAVSLGLPAGGLAAGQPADMTTIRLDSVRTAGARSGDVLAHALFSATAADVDRVIVAGRTVVADQVHVDDEAPGRALESAIAAVFA